MPAALTVLRFFVENAGVGRSRWGFFERALQLLERLPSPPHYGANNTNPPVEFFKYPPV